MEFLFRLSNYDDPALDVEAADFLPYPQGGLGNGMVEQSHEYEKSF